MQGLHRTQILGLLIFVVLLLGSDSALADERWWEREKDAPGPGQYVNPQYLSLRQDLQILLDRRRKAVVAARVQSARGHKVSAILASIRDMDREMAAKEERLSRLPHYLFRETPPTHQPAPSPQPRQPAPTPVAPVPAPVRTPPSKVAGTRLMLRLDLSAWSDRVLEDHSTVFRGTGGGDWIGVRIFQARYLQGAWKRYDELYEALGRPKTGPKMTYSDDTVMAEWSRDEGEQTSAIRETEKLLEAGKSVTIPLLYHGDDLSLKVPPGIYFLQYFVYLKAPANHNLKRRIWTGPTRVEANSWGPYYRVVYGDEQDIVVVTPKPREVALDDLGPYYERLRQLGAEALITRAEAEIQAAARSRAPPEAAPPAPTAPAPVVVRVRCLSCGGLSDDGAKFCQHCGKRLGPK